jgi:DNA-binding ferritin-like protein
LLAEEKPWKTPQAEKRVSELIMYVLTAEYIIKSPEDPVIAVKYKGFLQAIKDIAKKLFERYIQVKSFPIGAYDEDMQFQARIDRYKTTWPDFVEHVKRFSAWRASHQSTFYKSNISSDAKAEALKTLGFKPDEQPTETQLKERINELRRTFHPDLLRGEGKPEAEIKQAEEKLKKIHRAYDILTQ